MFKSFWGSQEQGTPAQPQEVPTNSWYPPSVVGSQNSPSRPPAPSSSSSNSFVHMHVDRPQSSVNVPPAEAAAIIHSLKDKSVDELRKLLSNKDAYQQLLHSLDMVKTQNSVWDDLRNETLQLARENLEKESYIMELRNQCRIIWTTELASAREKLNELERQKSEIMKSYSPPAMLQHIQETMIKTDEESETVHKQLLENECDLPVFIQKYKRLRGTYHKCALTHLAAKTSLMG
ncbi:hypothetical protein DCAR_0520231 [Daucus carota subsp. sativus]|uniref:VPS37 C-terminal domain-containing protein n=1 Tax=Daucus carota subsp. sativus TaxID=79200 RepID=A0AAF0X3Q8_DAUCS|nr:PREDICTED: vacuolar protein-sorting-associated protein 37 homolog 1-like [Daucus carota subsp. sativus]WOH00855.1 hypothetical protein DCAR_0520231 [Daucus carota subsp. sativus]